MFNTVPTSFTTYFWCSWFKEFYRIFRDNVHTTLTVILVRFGSWKCIENLCCGLVKCWTSACSSDHDSLETVPYLGGHPLDNKSSRWFICWKFSIRSITYFFKYQFNHKSSWLVHHHCLVLLNLLLLYCLIHNCLSCSVSLIVDKVPNFCGFIGHPIAN